MYAELWPVLLPLIMKNPSSTQNLSTGQESRSCGCTSEPMTGMNPVTEMPIQPMVQGFSEQPASGITLGRPGGPAMNGAKG